MKKSHKIFYVCFVLGVFLLMGVFAYFAEGNDLRSRVRYVRIDGVGGIEFLTDGKCVVTSFYPINEEGRVASVNTNFIGEKIEDVIPIFLDECSKLGYIDVDSHNNGIQISISSGFTQEFENDVYESCNKYFIEKEIYCVIAESDMSRSLFEEKVDKKVSTIEKLVVINSIMEKTDEYSFDKLNDNNESELLSIVDNLHNDYYNNININNDIFLTKYNNILSQSVDKYNNHVNKINKNTKREFVLKYAKFKKSQTPTWELDFQK